MTLPPVLRVRSPDCRDRRPKVRSQDGSNSSCGGWGRRLLSARPTTLLQWREVHMYQLPLALLHAGETSVRDQVHIRNAEAAQLGRTLARQTGKTISEVVLDALRQYRPQPHPRDGNRVELWRQLLHRDRARLTRPEVPIESFYNEETGLPK